MKKDPTNCGVTKTLRILSSRWTMHILHYLFDGTKRFGELQKLMPNISPKTLSIRLQELQVAGIINKKVYAEIPLHVECSLTSKGKSLEDIFFTMEDWGNKH